MSKKKSVYAENGLSALMVTPDELSGRWPWRLLGRIEATLVDRVERFGKLDSPGRNVGEAIASHFDYRPLL